VAVQVLAAHQGALLRVVVARVVRLARRAEARRAGAHKAEVRRVEVHQAVVLRVEAHRAPAAQRVVVALVVVLRVVVPRVAVCPAEARVAAPAAWKAETLIPVKGLWLEATRVSVTQPVEISRCPVLSMRNRSTVLRRVAAGVAVVQAVAPAMGAVAHRAVHRVERAMAAHHLALRTGKLHRTPGQIQVKARAREQQEVWNPTGVPLTP
jgi:hypothetical protein